MDSLTATDLNKLLTDPDFTGGTGHYHQARKDYLRLKSDHQLLNKKLLNSDSAKKMI